MLLDIGEPLCEAGLYLQMCEGDVVEQWNNGSATILGRPNHVTQGAAGRQLAWAGQGAQYG